MKEKMTERKIQNIVAYFMVVRDFTEAGMIEYQEYGSRGKLMLVKILQEWIFFQHEESSSNNVELESPLISLQE